MCDKNVKYKVSYNDSAGSRTFDTMQEAEDWATELVKTGNTLLRCFITKMESVLVVKSRDLQENKVPVKEVEHRK